MSELPDVEEGVDLGPREDGPLLADEDRPELAVAAETEAALHVPLVETMIRLPGIPRSSSPRAV